MASRPPDAASAPSGWKASAYTSRLWPSCSSKQAPASASHRRQVPSKLALPTCAPIGWKATRPSRMVWPASVRSGAPPGPTRLQATPQPVHQRARSVAAHGMTSLHTQEMQKRRRMQHTPQPQRAVCATRGQLHQAARVAAVAGGDIDVHGVRGGCGAGAVGACCRLACRIWVPCNACAPTATGPIKMRIVALSRSVCRSRCPRRHGAERPPGDAAPVAVRHPCLA